jgi:hypothetical protein
MSEPASGTLIGRDLTRARRISLYTHSARHILTLRMDGVTLDVHLSVSDLATIEKLLHRWQPMETAPRDGRPILVTWCGEVRLARWVTDAGEPNWQEWPDGDFEDIRGGEITAWMPRPEPHSTQENEK